MDWTNSSCHDACCKNYGPAPKIAPEERCLACIILKHRNTESRIAALEELAAHPPGFFRPAAGLLHAAFLWLVTR